MRLIVNFFFRKKTSGFHSIEELFGGIISSMQGVEPNWLATPRKRISIYNLIANLYWGWNNKGAVNHVTGDINYLALVLGKATVITFHDIGSLLTGNSLVVWLKKLLWIKWPSRIASVLTVVSYQSAKELESIIPNQAHKIRVIYNAISPALKMIRQEKKTHCSIPQLLVVGTKSNKNLDKIILAVRTLSVRIFIIGKISSAQRQLLEENKISFTNEYDLSYTQVLKKYKESDLLCFPSIYEGFGMPIIEAQYLGIPVLTSNFGAMKEVAGNGAHLVDPYAVEDIRKGIIKIMGSLSYRNDLIKKGVQNSKRFSPEAIAKQYMTIYLQLEKN